jgi:hypothetical protein
MTKELFIPSEKSFIGAWMIDDLSLCDDLIFYFENSSNKYPGVVYRQQVEIDRSEKDSIDVPLKLDEAISKRYIGELQKVLEMYKLKFPESDSVGKYGIEGINIQKYDPGGGYKMWHTERRNGKPPGVYRHLVFMTYLNDVSDCGETEFLYQKIKVKPEKGLTLIWPSDWTHTHRGIVSPTEIKYIITGWYGFYRDE